MGGKFRFAILALVVGCIALASSCGKLQNGTPSATLSDLLSGISGISGSELGALQLYFADVIPAAVTIKIDSIPVTSTILEGKVMTIPGVSAGSHTVEISATGYLPYSLSDIVIEKNKTTKCDEIALTLTPAAHSTGTILRLSMATNRVYLGVFNSSNSLSQFDNVTDKAPTLTGIFIPMVWQKAAVKSSQHIQTIQRMVNHNSVPVITWEPWDPGGDQSKNILPDIIAGKYDTEIVEWAIALKALNYPVVIRWGHEMQGDWYPWSKNPTLYRQAYQHMVTVFRAQNAHQVMWMFAPNHNDGGTGRKYTDYYPGADFVDLLGISGYNFGTTQPSWGSSWRSFENVFGPIVDDLSSRFNLPIILDVASAEQGGDKAAWIADMGQQLAENSRFDLIKGIVWFQEDKSRQGETNWRFDSSPEALAAFQELANQTQFLDKPLLRPVKI